MSTNIRPELSKKNRYYIPKNRYYELKYFCLQYKEWRKLYFTDRRSALSERPTEDEALYFVKLFERIDTVDTALMEIDPWLRTYIFKAVTDGTSYVALVTQYDLRCGKDEYYDQYHKFFWILDKKW